MWGGTAIGCGDLPPGREMPVYMVERLREGRLYLEPVEVPALTSIAPSTTSTDETRRRVLDGWSDHEVIERYPTRLRKSSTRCRSKVVAPSS